MSVKFDQCIPRGALLLWAGFVITLSACSSPSATKGSDLAELRASGTAVRLSEDFEQSGMPGWTVVQEGSGRGEIQLDTSRPRATNSPHALRLTVETPGSRCGLAQAAGHGVATAGEWYDLTFFAYSDSRENNRGYGLTVSLESEDGSQVCARTTIPEVGGDWNDYRLALHVRSSLKQPRLVITMSEAGEIWFDELSLSRRQTKQKTSTP